MLWAFTESLEAPHGGYNSPPKNKEAAWRKMHMEYTQYDIGGLLHNQLRNDFIEIGSPAIMGGYVILIHDVQNFI